MNGVTIWTPRRRYLIRLFTFSSDVLGTDLERKVVSFELKQLNVLKDKPMEWSLRILKAGSEKMNN